MRDHSIFDKIRREAEKELIRREKRKRMRRMKRKGSKMMWALVGFVGMLIVLKSLLTGRNRD